MSGERVSAATTRHTRRGGEGESVCVELMIFERARTPSSQPSKLKYQSDSDKQGMEGYRPVTG